MPAERVSGLLGEVVTPLPPGRLREEEELLGAVPPRTLRRARERGVPVVLPFPLPRRCSDDGRGRAYVAALIRRAVGYAVKLGGRGGEP